MDHALVMGRGKTEGGLVDDLRRRPRRHLVLALEQGAERFALDEFHDEVGLAFILADEVDLDDVRVVEGRHAACFTQEALFHALIVGQRLCQHLDCDIAVE